MIRFGRVAAACVALLAVFAPAGGATVGIAPACARVGVVPGIGRACRAGGVWAMQLPDGTVQLTHGLDDVRALFYRRANPLS
ncbi:MAG: hypothetical protein LC663_04505, partial [Actinobacteria bacterium]|nr:hypothetical protein [Actinomycetota bacterium]